mgnify:CR=1 FL=1
MMIVDVSGTGDDNVLTAEANDINYRKEQLMRLQEEVVDLEDLKTGISISDETNKIAFPLKTVKSDSLINEIHNINNTEVIEKIILLFRANNIFQVQSIEYLNIYHHEPNQQE